VGNAKTFMWVIAVSSENLELLQQFLEQKRPALLVTTFVPRGTRSVKKLRRALHKCNQKSASFLKLKVTERCL
jgi:hypothetical protein